MPVTYRVQPGDYVPPVGAVTDQRHVAVQL